MTTTPDTASLGPRPARPAPGWRAVASLAAFAALAAAVIGGADRLTRARIAANESAALRATLADLVPADQYDNALESDRLALPVDGPDRPLQPVYRARRAGQPVAVIYTTDAPDGYAGPIRLLVAVDPAGRLLATRAIDHSETPGIGDFVDRRDGGWLDQFAGRSLAGPDAARWQLASDDGDFDAVAGATVTSRAVVGGLRRTLAFHGRQGDDAWTP